MQAPGGHVQASLWPRTEAQRRSGASSAETVRTTRSRMTIRMYILGKPKYLFYQILGCVQKCRAALTGCGPKSENRNSGPEREGRTARGEGSRAINSVRGAEGEAIEHEDSCYG